MSGANPGVKFKKSIKKKKEERSYFRCRQMIFQDATSIINHVHASVVHIYKKGCDFISIHYTLYTIHYTLLYTIHYTLYTIHYTLPLYQFGPTLKKMRRRCKNVN